MIHIQIKNNSRQEKHMKRPEKLTPGNACRPDVKWSK